MGDGKIIKLIIWDTSGLERFISIKLPYYKETHGMILIYDMTNKRSFDSLDWFVRNIRDHSSSQIPIFLAGNKKDIEDRRVIKKEQGENFAKENNLMFSECSAKIGENIDNIFYQLVKAMMMRWHPEIWRRIEEEEEERKKREKEKEFEEKKLNIL